MQELFGNLWNLQWQQVVMWGIGGLLIWLAIKKEMEPSLLLPMGFGAILVNLPLSGAVTQVLSTGTEVGPLDVLFDAGIANELFPLLLFVGIGAMIDFTPLLSISLLLFFVLFHKEAFLLLNLPAQFFLSRHVCHILGSKNLVAVM